MTCLVVLPTGELTSGSIDGAIKIWNSPSNYVRVLVRTLTAHSFCVTKLAVLPRSRLASASRDRTVRIWDTRTWQLERTLTGHTGGVESLAVLSNGDIASGSQDWTIRIWDDKTGLTKKILSGHTTQVTSLAVLPNGYLASGSDWIDRDSRPSKILIVWNLKTSEIRQILEGHTKGVKDVLVLPSGELASSSKDGTIRIWEPATGQTIVTFNLGAGGWKDTARVLALLDSGELVAAGDRIRIWSKSKKASDSYGQVSLSAQLKVASLPSD